MNQFSVIMANKMDFEISEDININRNQDTNGFDMEAGKTWIYPTNYPLREYQYKMIEEALLKNTLVTLPTGLGKTFIAAVIMYNFYRWYPSGKVIFMAPTRPLVKQQFDACYKIMAIPKEVSVELTGSKTAESRKKIWKYKRVFFITPQVLQNDMSILDDLVTSIKCVVFDEAHRAKGNYAYCQIMRDLSSRNKYFRVLALSATPGNSLDSIAEVVKSLQISHLELRTDESPDVTPYIHERSLETVVISIGGKLSEIREAYIKILERYTRVLIKHKVFTGNCSTLTKGRIFMMLKEFQDKSRNHRADAHSEITKSLNICITLYHGYELLLRHGLRGFLTFFEEHSEKPLLKSNVDLKLLLDDIRSYLGPLPSVETLPDGSYPEIPADTKFGHPKFYKLCDVLLAHFAKSEQTGRVIVFCEYRESVLEAFILLLQQKPLIRPRMFLGQAKLSQKDQARVLELFRKGECNTLISTSIGEEGLDIGDVDLVVCFDINNKSPIRLIQRMGRTGRKREGRVVVLVSEGKEQMILKDCLAQRKFLSDNILKSPDLARNLYVDNPRMIPNDILPVCQKIHITEKKEVVSNHKSKVLKDMFESIEAKNSQEYSSAIFREDYKLQQKPHFLWNKRDPLSETTENPEKPNFWKSKNQYAHCIQPSRDTEILLNLRKYADSKAFNLPITQIPRCNSSTPVKPTKKSATLKSNQFKQSDIRCLFTKMLSQPGTSKQNDPIETIVIDDQCDIEMTENQKDCKINNNSDETLNFPPISDKCKICESLFDCTAYVERKERLVDFVVPDISVLKGVNRESLSSFKETLKSASNETVNGCEIDIPEMDIIEEKTDEEAEYSIFNTTFDVPKNLDFVLRKCEIANVSSPLKHKQSDKLENKNGKFVARNTMRNDSSSVIDSNFDDIKGAKKADNVSRKCNIKNDSFSKDQHKNKLENETENTTNNDCSSVINYFNNSDISDFVDMDIPNNSDVILKCNNELQNEDTANYSKFETGNTTKKDCSSLIDLFNNSDISEIVDISIVDKPRNDSNFLTQKITTESEHSKKSEDIRCVSPVLGSYEKIRKFKSKIQSTSSQKSQINKPNLSKLKDVCLSDVSEKCRKIETVVADDKMIAECDFSEFFINDFVDTSMMDSCNVIACDEKSTKNNGKQDEKSNKSEEEKIVLITETANKTDNDTNKETADLNNLLDVSDICDLSFFSFKKKRTQTKKLCLLKTKIQETSDDSTSDLENSTTNATLKNNENPEKTECIDYIDAETTIEKNHFASQKPSSSEDFDLDTTFRMLGKNKSRNFTNKSTQNFVAKNCKAKENDISEIPLASHVSSDSENEFDLPVRKKILNFPKSTNEAIKRLNRKNVKTSRNEVNNKKTKTLENPYIEYEAELIKEDFSVSEDEDINGDDCYDESFVDDATLDINSTQMHIKYLESVRSPKKIIKPKIHNKHISQIFSQEVDYGNETYVNDSFCVDSESPESNQEMSELEIAELILKQRRKRKKRQNSKNSHKRRILRVLNDNSD